jgi:hypothetical protein
MHTSGRRVRLHAIPSALIGSRRLRIIEIDFRSSREFTDGAQGPIGLSAP